MTRMRWTVQIYKCEFGIRNKNRSLVISSSWHWRHNDHDGVPNHQPHGCLLNRLFGRRSKKTLKLRVTGLCAGNSPGPVNSPFVQQGVCQGYPPVTSGFPSQRASKLFHIITLSCPEWSSARSSSILAIDIVELRRPFLPRKMISTTRVILVWKNDMK